MQQQDWRSLSIGEGSRRVAFRLADVDLGRTDLFLDMALITAVVDIPVPRMSICIRHSRRSKLLRGGAFPLGT